MFIIIIIIIYVYTNVFNDYSLSIIDKFRIKLNSVVFFTGYGFEYCCDSTENDFEYCCDSTENDFEYCYINVLLLTDFE